MIDVHLFTKKHKNFYLTENISLFFLEKFLETSDLIYVN